ncbi:MAG: histidine phosphatase family protein [Planctomycetes bacterium]|nr:histidine phosphatase family protein [Planctomycetota bacterium]
MKVVLLRHAPTSANLESRYMGKLDLPLAPQGERLASSLPARRDVATVYASTKRRCVRTAQILYPCATINQCAGLDEMDFGIFEGKNWRELENCAEYSAWLETKCESRCPGGEDKAGFTARVVSAFLHCFHVELAAHAEEMHMVVHGGVIMAVCERFAVPRRDYFDWRASYCGGYALDGRMIGDNCRLELVQEIPGPGLDSV